MITSYCIKKKKKAHLEESLAMAGSKYTVTQRLSSTSCTPGSSPSGLGPLSDKPYPDGGKMASSINRLIPYHLENPRGTLEIVTFSHQF